MVNDRRFPMPRRADKAPRDYVVRDVNGEALPRLRTVGIASVPEKMMLDPATRGPLLPTAPFRAFLNACAVPRGPVCPSKRTRCGPAERGPSSGQAAVPTPFRSSAKALRPFRFAHGEMEFVTHARGPKPHSFEPVVDSSVNARSASRPALGSSRDLANAFVLARRRTKIAGVLVEIS